MPERPLLILPPPGRPIERTKRPAPPPKLHFPTTARQGERLGPRFRALEQAFEARRAQVQTDPAGIVPEEVLVLETIGSVSNFMTAVRNVDGLEWLAEAEEEDIPPDEDFFDPKREAKPLSRRLYLLFSNIQAKDELLSLWSRRHSLPRGTRKWRQVFEQLHDIRHHQRLAGRITLDDPDGLEATYRAGERLHGTGMASLILHGSTQPPGQRVASPGPAPGDIAFTCSTRGTSNATALVTRAAVNLYDVVQDLRSEPGGQIIDAVPEAIWLKALLVHAADWGPAFDLLSGILRTPDNSRKFREYVTRILGYGGVRFARAAECAPSRATVLSGRRLEEDQVHVHRVPLPPALSGVRGWRRLTITLAWFTPINPRRHEWRKAQLWFEPARGDEDHLGVDRKQADSRAARRGTIQHEILEGAAAKAFVDGDVIEVCVNCRAGAGELEEAAPYALVVSLEVAEELGVPIYQEVRERVRAQVRVAPRP